MLGGGAATAWRTSTVMALGWTGRCQYLRGPRDTWCVASVIWIEASLAGFSMAPAAHTSEPATDTVPRLLQLRPKFVCRLPRVVPSPWFPVQSKEPAPQQPPPPTEHCPHESRPKVRGAIYPVFDPQSQQVLWQHPQPPPPRRPPWDLAPGASLRIAATHEEASEGSVLMPIREHDEVDGQRNLFRGRSRSPRPHSPLA